jgi:hypothetical protein
MLVLDVIPAVGRLQRLQLSVGLVAAFFHNAPSFVATSWQHLAGNAVLPNATLRYASQ